MKKNMVTIDRVIRIAVGGTLVAAAATGFLGAWAWLGVIFLVTGLISFCPLYTVLGINKKGV